MKLLNLGCGPVQPEGWTNVDPDPQWAPGALIADPLTGLPFPDGHFDGAVANHVLQMIAWPDLTRWLAEVRRVTAGPVRITVPDLAGAFYAAETGDIDWFPIADEHEPTINGKLCMYITQAGSTRSVFTSGYLSDLCARAGFKGAQSMDYGTSYVPVLASLDSRPHESIIVEAHP